MRNTLCNAAISLSVLLFSTTAIRAQYPAEVKIITYNINAETHTDGDYADIAEVINAINPTIAGLQKVDSFTVTTKPVDVLKYLGEETTMNNTFSMSYQKNNGSYGNGFLSDSVPKSSRRLAIPKGSASEDRSALEIGITMGGERVRVIVTHVAYDGETYRTAQLQQILPWIDEGGAATDPVVIMADFNAGPTTTSMKLLTDAGFAFVKGKNGKILDTTNNGINHILYRPEARWRINDAGNPVYAASNRNPLWADMELLDPVTAVLSSPSRFSGKIPQILHDRIHLSLDQPSTVSLRVVSPAGKLVRLFFNGSCLGSGDYSIKSGTDALSPGLYYGILSINASTFTLPFTAIR